MLDHKSTLVDHIARVDLRVRDLDRAAAFYGGVVGLEVLARGETRASMGPGGSEAILTLDTAGVTAPADPRATGLFHTAFLYPSRAALGDALHRLAEAGSRIGAGDHGVSEALYADDPDGNGIELYADRPFAAWPVTPHGELRMMTDPVDFDALLEASRAHDGPHPKAPPETRVGHVHLQVSELRRSVAFYIDALGLDLIQVMGGSAGFVSSHGYHHHIGFNIWNSRGGRAAGPERAGLQRVVIAVPDADEIVSLRGRLAGAGVAFEGDEAEPVVRDPDGIELQFVLRA